MWRDAMLACCPRPVGDVSRASIALTTPSPVDPGRGHFKSKLKLRRGDVVAPGIALERNSSRSDSCDRRSRERGHLNQQGIGSALPCKARSKRCPYSGKGPALGFAIVSVLAQESGAVVKVPGIGRSIGLTVSMGVVTTTKPDVGILGLTTSDMALYGMRQHTKETERYVTEDEMKRRRRISVANKGKVPWNKGGKHSPETIELIREKTMQAMRAPAVRAKLRLNARHPQTQETKVKIREKLKIKWEFKRKIKGYQDIMLKEWKDSVADAARRGGFGEEEMTWNSYFVLKKQMRLKAVAIARSERRLNRQKVKVSRPGKSQEHRQKISDAIRAKWEDPEYQEKVRQGMSRSFNFGEPNSSSVPRRRKSLRVATTEGTRVVKQPLDQGFVNAVMAGEKTEPRKKRAAKKKDQGSASDFAAAPKRGARYQSVDLLKKHCGPSPSSSMESPEMELASVGHPSEGETSTEERSVSPSPYANVDQTQKDAVHRAKFLMAEAERAIRVFEAIAGDNNESTQESLAEVQTLMAEAAQFIRVADAVNNGFSGGADLQSGEWVSASTSHGPPNSLLQAESQIGTTSGHSEGYNTSSSDSEAIGEDDSLPQREQDAASCVNSSSSTISDSAEAVIPNYELRKTAVWDANHPFTENSVGSGTVSSLVHLLNGRASKRIDSMMETKGNSFSQLWQHARLVSVEDEHSG